MILTICCDLSCDQRKLTGIAVRIAVQKLGVRLGASRERPPRAATRDLCQQCGGHWLTTTANRRDGRVPAPPGPAPRSRLRRAYDSATGSAALEDLRRLYHSQIIGLIDATAMRMKIGSRSFWMIANCPSP